MAETLAALPWVALGGAIGGPARFFLSGLIGRRFGETFPWGTLAVNVSGALAIGVLSVMLGAGGGSTWLFAVTGVLGSYTTVSSFSLQTLALARDGQVGAAGVHAGVSLAACIGAAAAGAWIASALL